MLPGLHRQARGLTLGLITLAVGAWLGLQIGACPMDGGSAHACQHAPAGHAQMGAGQGVTGDDCCPDGVCHLASPGHVVAVPTLAPAPAETDTLPVVLSPRFAAAGYVTTVAPFPPPRDYTPVHPLLRFCVLRI